MCGVSALWLSGSSSFNAENPEITPRSGAQLRESIIAMNQSLIHRGPNSSGEWVDEVSGFALGHTRLSILDVSCAGNQPMSSSAQDLICAYNGEIYNHLDLRRELQLEGRCIAWRGTSDTETLVNCLSAWGADKTLKKIVGMYAFAVFDRRRKVLTLARDRFGEKPLYYGFSSGIFMVASELKAFKSLRFFNPEIDRNALVDLLRYNMIPAPRCIYKDFYKLLPGHFLEVNSSDLERRRVSLKKYWSPTSYSPANYSGSMRSLKVNQVVARVREHIERSVQSQLNSDVPLGAFLSGGLDSSTIVAVAQRSMPQKLKTFTIGFDDFGFDEAPHARAVAAYLGTDHHEVRITASDAIQIVPLLPQIYDEPFADSSQIPTVLVSRIAKSLVSVSLSGDGGDELFGGYNRYLWGEVLWSRLRILPFPLRKLLGRLASVLPRSVSTNIHSKNLGKYSQIIDKLHRVSDKLTRIQKFEDLYLSLISEWYDVSHVLAERDDHLTAQDTSERKISCFEDRLLCEDFPDAMGYSQRMMCWDLLGYLPDDILCKVDRASMSVGLETRAPFLDRDLAEYVIGLPIDMKIRDGVGKWVLRQVLYDYVPKELVDRPKMGFSVPLGRWLRGPLKGWAEEMLDFRAMKHEGFFNAGVVGNIWKNHLSGRRDFSYRLWSILMFQSWLKSQ
jgi:asparagine synthase (glutamine-hydrolysing)